MAATAGARLREQTLHGFAPVAVAFPRDAAGIRRDGDLEPSDHRKSHEMLVSLLHLRIPPIDENPDGMRKTLKFLMSGGVLN
jgi:hypothetical protein